MQGVLSGNYGIFNCGTNSSSIVNLLQTLQSTLQAVLQDLDSQRSSRAFNTFFKDVRNVPTVRQVIQSITEGSPISVTDKGHRNYPGIVCITAPKQVFWTDLNGVYNDVYDRCLNRPRTAASSLLSTAEQPMIALCPHFFTWPAMPPMSKSNCLKVDSQAQFFSTSGRDMILFQLWVIMHELAHLYVHWTIGGKMDFYNVNDCILLLANESVQNAQSYAFYAASQCHDLRS